MRHLFPVTEASGWSGRMSFGVQCLLRRVLCSLCSRPKPPLGYSVFRKSLWEFWPWLQLNQDHPTPRKGIHGQEGEGKAGQEESKMWRGESTALPQVGPATPGRIPAHTGWLQSPSSPLLKALHFSDSCFALGKIASISPWRYPKDLLRFVASRI